MLTLRLEAEHVPSVRLRIAGETRENVCVTETGREYRFLMPGPSVTAAEWRDCAARIAALQPAPRDLVLAGDIHRL
ncbi:TPA: hypothetical protein ACK3Q6_000812 [Burkholderia cepacia]|uniref:hypothetical protein n=1 Tax=Burkholderia cepacia TaxID=292 RepID=UPI001CF559FF|nr:hypothetical protein [Burkholderia cepacia]MCA8362871.1 hypothetical protein [Burkholderia cepacia]